MSTEQDKYFYSGASFKEVWKRITEETDIKYLRDLGELVGVTQQNVSLRKKENLFPFGWAYIVAREKGLLTEWVVTGNGPMRPSEDGAQELYEFKILDEINEWLKGLVVQEPRRTDWFSVSFQDCFPMFREWKKRREKEESRSDIDPQSNVA